ncbi:type VI secretion system Vgr family protein [Paraburkholderia phosphatilytica]|uniref:type VI secretion system Vgr family protein n=1 Tax=Paraburkholderia phosphatilytica TaxID=2282883 RepID=UPI000E4D9BA8|nr:type VI secretion system Vgr family protein [Paraburkholderia phosphatilytica]
MAEGLEGDTLHHRQTLTGGQAYFFDVPGAPEAQALSVVSFEATERLGEPYRIVVRLTHPDALTRADYLGKDASFSIVPEGIEGRTFAGWISGFNELKTTRDFTSYEFVLDAHFARLAHVRTSRIYQHVTAPQIIEQVLRRHGFLGHQFSFRLRRRYPQHAFRFQYQMDDLAWVQLLMKQEGIYSYFTTGEHGDVLNLCDDIDHYVYQPTLEVPYREPAGLASRNDAVTSLKTVASTVARSFSVADYNPDNAWERLKDEANVAFQDTTTYGQPYVWGTHHLDAQGAKWEAQLRHEAAFAAQIVYEGQSSVLALSPARILHIDKALPDAPNGQVIVEVVHCGARDAAYTNTYKAIPSDRRFRLPLDEANWPRISGTLSARVTSPDKYQYAYLTAAGYYTVRFDADFDAWPAGGESVPLRLAKPFAGALQTGFHFPLLDGTEVAIAFHDGDPNRPYIAHAMHNSHAVDLVTSENRWLSRNVIRTQSDNKLQFEDWQGEEHVKLSTPHSGKSQLTLGHIVNGKRERRGEGFELRTDMQGSVRAGGGILVSAYVQKNASGLQTEMDGAISQFNLTQAQAEGLARSAFVAKAEVAELKAENQWLKEEFLGLKKAVIALTAPDGIGMATPGRVMISAGGDISAVTSSRFSLSAVKQVAVAAGEVISLFAQCMGIRLIAARGKVAIQAQSDAVEIVAHKNMQLTSASGTLTANAANGVVLQGGGTAYIKVQGDNVEIGGVGDLVLKVAAIDKRGAGSLVLPLPKFDLANVPGNEKFVVTDQIAGRPAPSRAYKIQVSDGRIVEGVTNDNGETSLTLNDVARGLKLLISRTKKGV